MQPAEPNPILYSKYVKGNRARIAHFRNFPRNSARTCNSCAKAPNHDRKIIENVFHFTSDSQELGLGAGRKIELRWREIFSRDWVATNRLESSHASGF